jgi:hypothetical protein
MFVIVSSAGKVERYWKMRQRSEIEVRQLS